MQLEMQLKSNLTIKRSVRASLKQTVPDDAANPTSVMMDEFKDKEFRLECKLFDLVMAV